MLLRELHVLFLEFIDCSLVVADQFLSLILKGLVLVN